MYVVCQVRICAQVKCLTLLLRVLSAVILFTHSKSHQAMLYIVPCGMVVITVPFGSVLCGVVMHCSHGKFNHTGPYLACLVFLRDM